MKEVTRVVTAKITMIETLTDDDADGVVAYKSAAEKNVRKELTERYHPVDLQVEIKDFVRNLSEQKKDNWISIEDDYPPELTDVLVSIQGAMAIGHHFNKQFTVYGRQDTEVEAWRFLPEGYQPGGGEYYI